MMQPITKLLLIIGSAKAGTSALAHFLSLHPGFTAGVKKEPRFFTNFRSARWAGPGADFFVRGMIGTPEAYLQNFPDLAADRWAIDASTDYIWCPDSPDLISAFARNCDVRIIAVVRDPVERAVSQYNHTLRFRWENLSFLRAAEAEKTRFEQGWHPLFYHARRSRVHDDIMRYHAAFADRLLVLDYEDLRDTEALMRKLAGFLDVPLHAAASIEARNVSYLPRNQLARQALGSSRLKAIGKAILPQSVRRSIRSMLLTNARNLQTVRPDEREAFRRLLADEIAQCIDAPLIPTDRWTCSRPLA
jgi:hypothetical protein